MTSLHSADDSVNPDGNPLPDRATIIAGALDALAQNCYIVPVDPADKAPMPTGGLKPNGEPRRFLTQPYLDGKRNLTPADVERWAARGALFAVAPKPSGLIVLDLDALDPNDAGPLSDCFAGPHVTPTRSGGRHAWHIRPAGLAPERKIKAEGLPVDVLGAGYVILWSGAVPADLPPLPPAVLPLIDPPRPATTSGNGASMRGGRPSGGPCPHWPSDGSSADDLRAFVGAECADVERTTTGARNNRLNLATFRTARRAWAAPEVEGEARAALELAGLATGLPLAEVRRTIAGAWERGTRNPFIPRPPRRDDQGPAGEDCQLDASRAAWAADADTFIRQNVKNGAAKERNRRLVEKSAELAGDDDLFACGVRSLGQRAGLSEASAARGAREIVALGVWEIVTPWSIDADTGKRKPTVYRLSRAFGDGDTVFQPFGSGGSVSPAAKRVPVALRVGLGKRAADSPAYLSTRWRTYIELRKAGDAGERRSAQAVADVLGIARRTAADHVKQLEALGVVDCQSEATGGRPRGLWAIAAAAGQAVARVTEWGRATLEKRWRRIQRAWAALDARGGAPPPSPDEQSFTLRVERFARENGGVVL